MKKITCQPGTNNKIGGSEWIYVLFSYPKCRMIKDIAELFNNSNSVDGYYYYHYYIYYYEKLSYDYCYKIYYICG